MWPKIILVTLALFVGNVFYGQQTNSQKLDLDLTRDFNEMIGAWGDSWNHFDSLIQAFKKRIKKDLVTQTAFNSRFDSLSKEMHINRSKDKLLRIFSWDERSGGTWHVMCSFAQFKTESGSIRTKELGTGREMELGQYTDVIIQHIYDITIKNKTHYLTIGWGTHGAGHHHSTAQVFSIEGEKLVKCKNCFEGRSDLVVVSGRSFNPTIKYDPLTQQLMYNEFFEDEGNYMTPTGKVIVLNLHDDQFKKGKRSTSIAPEKAASTFLYYSLVFFSPSIFHPLLPPDIHRVLNQ